MSIIDIKYTPKFKVGDIVCYNDNFSANPADKQVGIGEVKSIKIKQGKGLFKQRDLRGVITYRISGYSSDIAEKDLDVYNGKNS